MGHQIADQTLISKFYLLFKKSAFEASLLNRMSCLPYVPAWSACQRANKLAQVPKARTSQYSQENTCTGVFSNEVASLKDCNYIKERLQHGCFPVNIAKFLRTAFLTEHLRWLLLYFRHYNTRKHSQKKRKETQSQ